MAYNVGNVITNAGKNASALEHSNQQPGHEASAFDVWTQTYDGMSQHMRDFADDPAGTVERYDRDLDKAVTAGLTGEWHSSSFSSVADSITAQAGGLGDAVKAIVGADGALATVGATFALLTGVEQMLSTLVSVIPFPALPAIRIMDMDVGLPHAHAHPPNLIPPAPPVPLPSTGPIIPIPILSGATRTLINSMPAGRCGDMGLGIWCGGYFPMYEVFLGSSSVWIEGSRAGRLAVDITKHCIFTSPKPSDPPIGPMVGVTIMASTNVLIGGVPMPSLLSMAMGAAMKGLFKGVGKAIRSFSRTVQRILPEGNRLSRALCAITGHPVDVSSGRVFTDHVDFELAGHVRIALCRTYDSSAVGYVGSLGPGWTHPFDVRLWVDDQQNMVVLRDREARVVGFERVAIGAETFNPVERLWLSRVGERHYVLRDADALRWHFGMPVSVTHDEDGRTEARSLRLIGVEDRNDNWLRCDYDGWNLVRIADSAGRTLVFQNREPGTRVVRLLSVHLFSRDTSTSGQRLVSFEYDENDRLVAAVDAEGHATRYGYTGDLLSAETNRNGLTFHFRYDGHGSGARCIRTWGDGDLFARTLVYHPDARGADVTDSLGAVTQYVFDASGRTLQIREPAGGLVRFEYDALGNLTKEIDEAGGVTEYEYDASSNRTRITLPDGATTRTRYDARGLALETIDAAGATWRFEYDERGNMVARIDALGNRWSYEFDQRGNWRTARDPEGRVTHYQHDQRGLPTRVRHGARWYDVAYDDYGNVVESRDALGNVSRFEHDKNGRLVWISTLKDSYSRRRYDGEGNLIEHEDAEGRVTHWAYEGMNKISAQIDASGLARRFHYDTEGRLVEIRNELGEAFRFQYDPSGNLVRQVGFAGEEWLFEHNRTGGVTATKDPLGRVIRYERDPRNRLLRKRLPDRALKTFKYDALGRLILATGESTLAFEYDANGRLVSEAQEDGTIHYQYDASGRRVRRTSHIGNVLSYGYDEGGRLEQLTTDRGSVRFEIDAAGRLVERTCPGRVHETRRYDEGGRLVRQEILSGGQQVALRTYAYDREYNLLELSNTGRRSEDIRYDPCERLERVTSERDDWRFEFDPAGNLLNDSERDYEYGSGNRLTRMGDTVFGFDRLGSLVEQRTGSGVARFEYDAENQLTAVIDATGDRTEFSYDAMGRRIEKRTARGKWHYRWDDWVLLSERGTATSTEYIIDSNSSEPQFRLTDKGFEVFHNDFLGTPQEVTNQDGKVVWAATYHPYGELQSLEANESPQPIRFKGQYADSETGLYYNVYRYYAPRLRRYLNQDPFGIQADLNLYRYTINPVNWTDPLGLFDEFESAPYGNAGHARDGLDADELLGSAWLRHHGYGNRSSSMGRKNPAVALDPTFHKSVSAAQREAGLFDADTLRGQTAGQNIRANAQIRRDLLRERFIAEGMTPRAARIEANKIIDRLERQANAYVKANRLIKTC